MPSLLYRDLDSTRNEIRLLLLLPGSGLDPVRCTFERAFLSDDTAPAYDTISYVWGDAAFRGSVYFGDYAQGVPASAERALRHVRLAKQERTVWIDAVCIDQSNIAERSHQVALMREIYSKSKLNHILLGFEEDDAIAAEALATVQSLFNEAQKETDNFATWRETVMPSGSWVWSTKPSTVPLSGQPLIRLFSSKWFSRLWAVQEAALAPESHCHHGIYKIPLLPVLRAAVWLYNKSFFLQSEWPSVEYANLTRVAHAARYTDGALRTKFSFCELLADLRPCDATDPKDHVYGLLGLYQEFSSIGHVLPPALTPQYNRQLGDIFCDATRYGIEESKRLSVLREVSHRSNEVLQSGLPTWVPKWDKTWDPEWDPEGLDSGIYKASLDHVVLANPFESESRDSRVLSLGGFTIDVIQGVSEILTSELERSADGFLNQLQYIESIIPGPETNRGGLGYTLVAATDFTRTEIHRDQGTKGYRALRKYLEEQHSIPLFNATESQGTDPELKIAGDYNEALWRRCRNRRFFASKTGYIGTGPRVMQPGDVVVVLYGSTVPFILRPHADTYILIGQAYVDTIMFGEAVEAHRAASAKDEIYSLV